jgi:signal transduction histidine kinase
VAGVRQEEIDRLWLAALQRLAASVVHELRNGLNGVAVNVEVVRSRAGREGVPATALEGFATSAADQLQQVIALTEAMVALSRPVAQPAAVARYADQVSTLVRAPLVASGGTLDLVVEGEGTTRVPADAARLLVAAAFQSAVEATQGDKGDGVRQLRCKVRPAEGVELAVEGRFDAPPRLSPEVERVAGALGVRAQGTASGITLTFPA